MIPLTVRDEVHQEPGTKAKKTRKLLSAVEGKIAIEPDTFDVFLIILKQEPTLQILADRLRASYGELKPTVVGTACLGSISTGK